MDEEEEWHAIAVLYKAEETRVGTDIYAHIQCFRGKLSQVSASAFRTSAPFVLTRRYGSREVVPGSIVEALRNIRRLIERLGQSTAQSAERLQGLAEGLEREIEYQEYELEVVNTLVLVSCHLRNVFDVFPAVGRKLSVPMFDYEGRRVDSVKMRILLDLFVHNRHMHLHNEYVTDLFSDKLRPGTIFAEEFMGYRFKVNDFLALVQQAIHGVTLKHLGTRLRRDMKRLTTDTPHYKMVFLIQNIVSFSGLFGGAAARRQGCPLGHALPDEGLAGRGDRGRPRPRRGRDR